MPKVTHINVILSELENKVLTESARRNKRSKSKEAQARISDHLRRFEEAGFVEKKVKA